MESRYVVVFMKRVKSTSFELLEESELAIWHRRLCLEVHARDEAVWADHELYLGSSVCDPATWTTKSTVCPPPRKREASQHLSFAS